MTISRRRYARAFAVGNAATPTAPALVAAQCAPRDLCLKCICVLPVRAFVDTYTKSRRWCNIARVRVTTSIFMLHLATGCGAILGLDEFTDATKADGTSAGGQGSGSGGTSAGGQGSGSGGTSAGGQGGAGGCVDPDKDCAPPTNPCMEAACEAGSCKEVPRPKRTSCTETGAALCDGAGNCVECTDDDDCKIGTCEASKCVTTCGSPDVMATPRSCASSTSASPSCGASSNTSCCDNRLVECGTFFRSYDRSADYSDKSHPATVSDFRLDTFEVTVGRFRAFLEAGKGTQLPGSPPARGDGRHPKIPDSGWDPRWDSNLAVDADALKAELRNEGGTVGTWTDAPGANENLPIMKITWFEAFAFCAWDGGRLPTEAEWNYAAAGGEEQREYPWGIGFDDGRAAYFGNNRGIPAVGSKPDGNGRWDHADLAGSLWEWTLDWYNSNYVVPCIDCANLANGSYRVIRGGSVFEHPPSLRASYRNYDEPTSRGGIGVRCARDP